MKNTCLSHFSWPLGTLPAALLSAAFCTGASLASDLAFLAFAASSLAGLAYLSPVALSSFLGVASALGGLSPFMSLASRGSIIFFFGVGGYGARLIMPLLVSWKTAPCLSTDGGAMNILAGSG